MDFFTYIFLVALIAFFVFVIWMFVDMCLSKKLNKMTKGIWIVLFLITAGLTSIVWAFVRK